MACAFLPCGRKGRAIITHTVGGLAVDTAEGAARRATTLPGLYAAGVEVGGVSVGGYTSGLASALVFGGTAAESAIADIQELDGP